jgi:hypothetical protein
MSRRSHIMPLAIAPLARIPLAALAVLLLVACERQQDAPGARGQVNLVSTTDIAANLEVGGIRQPVTGRVSFHLVSDRAGLERLLRYFARPPFALERLDQLADDQASPSRSPMDAANCASRPWSSSTFWPR